MNEILAPIMYVLGALPGSDEENYEADSFFCFAALMSEIRDLFIRSLDGEKFGLHGQIKALGDMLQKYDPAVAARLDELQIHTQFFAVRWLTTLLTREFELPDVFPLWDVMLASKSRFQYARCCCAALIIAKRDFLLKNDFPACLKLLQATGTTPVHVVIKGADQIYELESRPQVAASQSSKIMAKLPFVSADTKAKVESFAFDMFSQARAAARVVAEEARHAMEELTKPDEGIIVRPPSRTVSNGQARVVSQSG
jgi:hypothetical protein